MFYMHDTLVQNKPYEGKKKRIYEYCLSYKFFKVNFISYFIKTIYNIIPKKLIVI